MRVQLIGGSYDSHFINWSGGDVIRMRPLRPMPSRWPEPTPTVETVTDELYRQSLNTKWLFVFQP